MILTDKCKKDFERWYRDNDFEFCIGYPNGLDDTDMCEDFYDLPLSYQYGVYVDFFDSVGIDLDVFLLRNRFCIMVINKGDEVCSELSKYRTRHEARGEAIKKANEIYNKQ